VATRWRAFRAAGDADGLNQQQAASLLDRRDNGAVEAAG